MAIAGACAYNDQTIDAEGQKYTDALAEHFPNMYVRRSHSMREDHGQDRDSAKRQGKTGPDDWVPHLIYKNPVV